MKSPRLLPYFLAYISVILTYFIVSVLLNYRIYFFFSFAFSVIVLGTMSLICVKSVLKNLKKSASKNVESFSLILLCAALIFSKDFIDHKNIALLKNPSGDISVYKIVLTDKERKEYEKAFKTNKFQDITIYYKDDLEPVLDLVQVYLNKVRTDNLRLFGDITDGELAIKFDYDEEVFKRRDPDFKDYAGLYSYNEKTAYLFIKDCYTNALALNLKSSYLREVLRHEYTHYIVHELLNSSQIPVNRIPVWFIEGISEYIGYEGEAWNTPEKLSDFKDLSTQKQWEEYSNKGYNPYPQSYFAVRGLVLKKGEKVIKEILSGCKDKDFETAFREVSGVSLQEYEKTLNEDFKNGWKGYDKAIPGYNQGSYNEVRIKCFEKYINGNSGHLNALLDLALLYERAGSPDKAKQRLEVAAEKNPDSTMAWRRLALINQDTRDFEGAEKAYEKEISLDETGAGGYLNLAQTLLFKDLNEAAAAAQKARELDKTSYIGKATQAILDFQSAVKKGKPYEGGLQLIKSDTLFPDNLKTAFIEKLIRDYPGVKNSARSELEKLRVSYSKGVAK